MKRIISYILTAVLFLSLTLVTPVYAENQNETSYNYDGYTVNYQIKSQWDNSQTIGIKITNTGTEPILNWAVKYNAGGIISELSNAAVYEQSDKVYTLKNAGHNYEIKPGKNVSFNYTVTGQGLEIPEQIKLVSKKVTKQDGFDVKFKADDWGTGFQADVTVTNTTGKPIEGWTLTFNGNFTIQNIWNSKIIAENENSYTIVNQSLTNVIPSNSSVTFSFTGSKDAGSEVALTDFILTEIIISNEPERPERPDDGIIDQGDIEELIALGQIEVIRGEDGSFRVIDGTFTNHLVNSTSDAATILNSASSLFGDKFHSDASEIAAQSLESDGEAGKEIVYRYSPLVSGVPVLGCQIVLITDGSGIVKSLFNTYNNKINSVSTNPTISEQAAETTATDKLLANESITNFLQKVTDKSGSDYNTVKNEFLSMLTIDTQLLVYAVSDKSSPALAWAVSLNTNMDESNRYTTHTVSGQLSDSYTDFSINDSKNTETQDDTSDLHTEEETVNPDSVQTVSTVSGQLTEVSDDVSDKDMLSAASSEAAIMPFISETVYIYANGASAGSIISTISNIEGWSPVTREAKDLLNNNRTFEAQEEDDHYRLRDDGRGIETYKSTYGGFLWMTPELPGELIEFSDTPDKSAVSAHANMAAVYDFYKNTLKRSSFDDHGATVKSSIGYDDNTWLMGKYNNAYWSPALQQFVFGNAGNFEAALDVIGHEYTHAVVNYVVGNGRSTTLTYFGESGALNEAYADILGNIIENKSDDGKWLVGEDSAQALRNMADPSQYGQPEHYDNRETGSYDNGGVHINSGIFNFAAHKMIADNRTSSISNGTWAKVFYRSLFRLSTNATFLDARGAVISTAKSLGFNQTQQQAIKDAFDEVGIVEYQSIRIVLRWGAQPRDLDSHLIGPAVAGSGKFHIYYNQRSYFQNGSYSSSEQLYAADLDYDDTSSYGPEITTIHTLTPGDYYFYVHDYTNRSSSSSTALAKSGANVMVYSGASSEPLKTFEIDSSTNGNLWLAFKLTIGADGNQTFTPMETYSYQSNPANIGS